MSRLKSALSRLESRSVKPTDLCRVCSCEWAGEQRRAVDVGPEGMDHELRTMLIAAAAEWNDPDHPCNSRPEEFRAQSLARYEERKASLQYWSQPNEDLGLCEACPMPAKKRRHLALLNEIHELPWGF